MRHLHRLLQTTCSLIIFAALGGVAMGQGHEAAPATRPDMQQQLDAMRAQMDQMRIHEQTMEKQLVEAQKQATTRPDEASQADIRTATETVMKDAQNHTFSDDLTGATAGWDKGFFIRSDDGNYLVHPFFLLQVRDVTDWRDHGKADGSSDTENGFEIRRMQLGAEGNVFNPDVTYRVFIQTERDSGEAELFDAWVKYHFSGTPWYIEGGQFKAPLDHEQMTMDKNLLAADRTLTDDVLARGEAFSEGIMGIYDNDDNFRGKMDFTNGYGANDVNFEDVPARPTNFGLGGRAEYKVFGNWKSYDEFTSQAGHGDVLVIGGGADWSEGEPTDAIRHAVDIAWNPGPFGFYAAYLGMYTARNTNTPTGTKTNTYDSSGRIQAAYLIPRTALEPFIRFDYLHLDGKEFASGTNNNISEITLGTNYYFKGQSAKVTLDGTYLPNGSPVDDNGSGVLENNGHAEVVVRVQFQLSL